MHWSKKALNRIASLKSSNSGQGAKPIPWLSTPKISEPVNATTSPTTATPGSLRPDDEARSTSTIAEGDKDLLKLQDGAQPVCQIMSDLHLEWRGYEQYQITKEAPTVLLIGDIGRFCDYDRFLGFLKRQCEIFDRVLLVPGNHEFYKSSRQRGLELAEKLDHDLGDKFKFMHRERVDLNNGEIVIFGCTLHSQIPDDYTALTNDFNQIDRWKVRHHNEEHVADLEWLKQSLADIDNSSRHSRVIIATHYAPAFEKTVQPAHEHSNLRHCFCSRTLERFQDWPGANQVSHWVFGHTHYNARFLYNGMVVVSNQPPGPFSDQSPGWQFDPQLVI